MTLDGFFGSIFKGAIRALWIQIGHVNVLPFYGIRLIARHILCLVISLEQRRLPVSEYCEDSPENEEETNDERNDDNENDDDANDDEFSACRDLEEGMETSW
jgi:hypothetical protein